MFTLSIIVSISCLRTIARILFYITELSATATKGLFSHLLRIYVCLQLVLQLWAKMQESGAIFLMGFCGLISVFINFTALKLYEILPIYIYLPFPIVAVIILTAFDFVLPVTAKVNEISTGILVKWSVDVLNVFKEDANTSKRFLLYKRKIVSSISPIRVFAGIGGNNFFWFMKSTKITFYDNIVTHTINLLLNVPKHVIQKIGRQ
jgi:hypothetical protein